MNIILTKIVSVVIAPVLLLTGLLGITPAKYQSQNLGAVVPVAVGFFESSLANSITSSATSMTLVSGTTKDGTTLATSTYGFVIDEGTANEELVLATCVNTSCTSMTRGVSVITGNTSITALQKAHRRGASVKITDAPQLLILSRIVNGDETIPNALSYTASPSFATSTQLVDKNYVDALSTSTDATAVHLTGTETITGDKTFSGSNEFTDQLTIMETPVANTDAASKAYVDGVAIAGAPVANETTTGAGRVATSTQIASGYASTTPYFIPSSLASSTASTTASIVVVAKSNGKIDSTFLPTISSSATTTLSVTTIAGERIIVWAKGWNDANSGTISLKYGGVTKDSIDYLLGSGGDEPFALMYTEIPGAGTADITVTTSSGALHDVKIIAQII